MEPWVYQSPDLTIGYRCKFALKAAGPAKKVIFTSGYPSPHIYKLDFTNGGIQSFLVYSPTYGHVDKFALNSNYLVVPVLNLGLI